ncbi:MAG TPA: hypothetical protein VG796_22375 [Verrucomicrobiales bacterium]|nr:hypothetical protein [Verrucomicrobiales bacterium]
MIFSARRLRIAAAWLACVGLAYGAGLLLRGADGSGGNRHAASKFLSPASDAGNVSRASAKDPNSESPAVSPASATLPERVRAIFSLRDAGPRGVALIECLDDAGAADMEPIAEMLGEFDYHRCEPEIDLFFERWVLMDGEAAMAWQDEHGFSDVHTRPMLIAWTGSDPRGALAWVQWKNEPGSFRAQDIGQGSTKKNIILSLEEAAIRGWAQHDPAGAMAFRLDPANAAVFSGDIVPAPADHGVDLLTFVSAVQDSAGTAGLTKWIAQLQSVPHAPPDLASAAFGLMCEDLTAPERRMEESTLALLRANAGKPWFPPDTLRDTLWKVYGGKGEDVQALLDVSERLGPDPSTGAPWFTRESAVARKETEEQAQRQKGARISNRPGAMNLTLRKARTDGADCLRLSPGAG